MLSKTNDVKKGKSVDSTGFKNLVKAGLNHPATARENLFISVLYERGVIVDIVYMVIHLSPRAHLHPSHHVPLTLTGVNIKDRKDLTISKHS